MTPAQEKDSCFSLSHYYSIPFLKIMLVCPFYRNMFQIQVNHWLPVNQIAIEMWQNLYHHTWCAWPIGHALLSPEAKLWWIQMSGWTVRQLWSRLTHRSCGFLMVPVIDTILDMPHTNQLERRSHFGQFQHLHGGVVPESKRKCVNQ